MEGLGLFGILIVVVLIALPVILLARISHWANKTYLEARQSNELLRRLCENEKKKDE